MIRHVRGGNGMARGPRRRSGCQIRGLTRGRVRLNRGFPRGAHADLATRPRTRRLDRPLWPIILGCALGKERQDVLGARGCPFCQQMVARQVEQTAAMDRYETWISRHDILLIGC
jgi:hypothetical protein